MKTINQIKDRARSIALSHFYSDYDNLTAWQPFERYSEEWLEDEVDNMTDMLIKQMLWAQSNV